jgi:uncharacterized protein
MAAEKRLLSSLICSALLQCEKFHSAETQGIKQPGNAGPWWKPVTIRALCLSSPGFSIMKLHSSSTEKYQTVTGYDQSGVEINAQRFDYSVLVMPEVAPRPWPVTRFEDLKAEHFDAIAADKPDVVILGTGERQRFVHPRLVASLSNLRIGVESMDSHAACRTYNILMGEGRKVTLALIIDNNNEGATAP